MPRGTRTPPSRCWYCHSAATPFSHADPEARHHHCAGCHTQLPYLQPAARRNGLPRLAQGPGLFPEHRAGLRRPYRPVPELLPHAAAGVDKSPASCVWPGCSSGLSKHPSRRTGAAGASPVPGEGTANAVIAAVGEFLRFGATHGWVPTTTTALLSEPKLLRFTPPGYDTGVLSKQRQVHVAAFRFKIAEPGYEDLSDEQIRG